MLASARAVRSAKPAAVAALQVGSIVNFSLMYLLAPVASAAGAGAKLGLVQKIFGEHYLAKWGAPSECRPPAPRRG